MQGGSTDAWSSCSCKHKSLGASVLRL